MYKTKNVKDVNSLDALLKKELFINLRKGIIINIVFYYQ